MVGALTVALKLAFLPLADTWTEMLELETVPDVHTVAVLEDALGVALWPEYPRA